MLTKGPCVHRESQLTLRISRMDQLRAYEFTLRGDRDTSANLKAYFCHFSLSCFLFAARSAFPTGYVLSCGASQVWLLSLSKPWRHGDLPVVPLACCWKCSLPCFPARCECSSLPLSSEAHLNSHPQPAEHR